MKILVLTDLYPPYLRGGAELSCQSQVEALQKRGHAVQVLTSTWGLPRGRPSNEGQVFRLMRYHSANPAPTGRWAPWFLHAAVGRTRQILGALELRQNYAIARQVISQWKPDLVYAWHMQQVSIAPVLAAQDLGIPVVFRLPDYWLADLKAGIKDEPNPLKRWYRSWTAGMGGFDRLDINRLLPNSWALYQEYLRAGFPAGTMYLIPNGIPAGMIVPPRDLILKPPMGRNGVIQLVYAGRLSREKGVDVAIQALAALIRERPAERFGLDIIGSGSDSYQRELRALILRLGIAENVTFLGQLDHRHLLNRLGLYDIMIVPSRWVEPFSRVILEAMASGLPVIATNTGGTLEIIMDGFNGLLVPPDDPSAISRSVQRLLDSAMLAEGIRLNAVETLRTNFDLDVFISQTEEYLQHVLHPAAGMAEGEGALFQSAEGS